MIKPIDPTTNIAGLNNLRVGDFWKWGYSDMLNSGNRGTFAEFLVRAALGELKLGSTYLERGSSVDIDYQGKKLQVKAAAYIQSWPQKRITPIKFDICMKKTDNKKSSVFEHKVDCYVLCLFTETDFMLDKNTAIERMLDTKNWKFYVLSKSQLQGFFQSTASGAVKTNKSISLSTVKSKTVRIHYNELKGKVDKVLGLSV